MYSGIYWLISFKLGMMIETTKLYIFTSVWMTLIIIKGHTGVCEITSSSVHSLANFNISLDEIPYVATTCWFAEAHAKFILHNLYLSKRTLLTQFYSTAATKVLMMVDYARRMIVKSCRYGEYGSFEHLLILFSWSVSQKIKMRIWWTGFQIILHKRVNLYFDECLKRTGLTSFLM